MLYEKIKETILSEDWWEQTPTQYNPATGEAVTGGYRYTGKPGEENGEVVPTGLLKGDFSEDAWFMKPPGEMHTNITAGVCVMFTICVAVLAIGGIIAG